VGLTNQTPSQTVQHIFDNIAGNYDVMNNVISLGFHKRWRRVVNAKLALQPGDHILDVCCGTGVWTFSLGQAVGASGQVTGLDFSTGMLRIAEDHLKTYQGDNINFIQGDAQKLPFADNSFDRVVIGFGLRNVPDANKVLAEMYRVLKPGGQAACLETSQPTNLIMHAGWELYFGKVLPLLGGAIHHYHEYNYLQQSTHHFVSAEVLKSLFLRAGFDDVSYDQFVAGSAAVHYGTKS
jgi:demethylmenaquinone methyltransferase/2-methoxy-6-polyprenyl-1,4-benzoquinol methylase